MFCRCRARQRNMSYAGVAIGMDAEEPPRPPGPAVDELRLDKVPVYMLVRLDEPVCLKPEGEASYI